MTLMRNVLLYMGRNHWLADRANRYRFVRRAVSRFLPGEMVEDALRAATDLRTEGISAVLTRLGEDVTDSADAYRGANQYLHALDGIGALGLDADLSVKLTQLGLDLDASVCAQHLRTIVDHAAKMGRFVTIDMESTRHTDATLKIFRKTREQYCNVGVCLQAYLHRTASDVDAIVPLGPTVRLVKGAYNEPKEVAFSRKSEVDVNFLALTRRLLAEKARTMGTKVVLGTHDMRLVRQAIDIARSSDVAADALEVQMLYGIRNQEQRTLAREGRPIRVLISYGEAWFPWYMRRLAERPANLLFVARHVFSRA